MAENGSVEKAEKDAEDDFSKDDTPKNDFLPPAEPETVFEKEIYFLIDTKKPSKVHFLYNRAIRDDSILTNEPIELTLKSTDEGSGMEAIYDRTGDGAAETLTGDSGSLILNPGFHGRVEAIKVFFYDLAITVVGYLRSMAQAAEDLLNKIPGVNVDITGSLGMDDFYSELQQRSQKLKDASGWVEYVEKQDYLDYASVARKGYDIGAGAADWVKGKLGIGTPDALDDLYSAAADTAGNTAKMANSMEVAEEDLKYLRDIAEREAINRFTTAEIRIEQHNENHIGSGMDVDGIMDKWCGAFAEQLNISAEGVHE